MHKLRLLGVGLVMLLVALAIQVTPQTRLSAGGFPTPSLTGGTYFVHMASSDNTTGHITEIRHPLLDGNPDAIFFVTPSWGPIGITGVYYTAPYGVYYFNGTWRIFSQDFTAIPAGATFNIYIPDSTVPAFIHTATPSNTTDYYTEISSPYLTSPNDIILVTQRWDPYSVYNPHHIGVAYDGGWFIYNQDSANIPPNASFNVAVISQMPRAFQHVTTADNISGHISSISNPQTDGWSEAVLQAAPSSVGAFNPHGTGVWYNSGKKQWSVFNQDLATMPPNVLFNMLVAPQTSTQFTIRAPSPSSNYVELNNPMLNDNIGALVFATTRGSITNEHPTGVFFKSSSPLSTQSAASTSQVPGRWAIYNEDLGLMPDGVEFNVFAPAPSLRAFVHTTTSDNVDAHRTILDHPMLNGNPDAIVFIEHSWNPDGESPGVYHNRYTGVFYDAGLERWVIFNQDNSTMPTGLAFNVFVANGMPNAFVHQPTEGNGNNSSITYLDSPLTNDNPNAIIIVTPRYGAFNDFPIGVWYHPALGQWAIVSQDSSLFSNLHQFNVLVLNNYEVFLPLSIEN